MFKIQDIYESNQRIIWELLEDIFEEYAKFFRAQSNPRALTPTFRSSRATSATASFTAKARPRRPLSASRILRSSRNENNLNGSFEHHNEQTPLTEQDFNNEDIFAYKKLVQQQQQRNPQRETETDQPDKTEVTNYEKINSTPQPNPTPSPQNQQFIVNFLHELNLDHYLAQSTSQKGDFLKDPLRNGALLCRVLNEYCKKKLGTQGYSEAFMKKNLETLISQKKFIRFKKNTMTIVEAKLNITTCFQALQSMNRLPLALLHNTEDRILKGDFGLLFEIIHEMKIKLFDQLLTQNSNSNASGTSNSNNGTPGSNKTVSKSLDSSVLLNNSRLKSQNPNPGTPGRNNTNISINNKPNPQKKPPQESARSQLENEIISWMGNLGLFSENQAWPNFMQLLDLIHDGAILCDLIMLVEGKKLFGVNRSPKIDTARISNITKALSALRANPKMNTRNLFKEESILHKDPSVVLGLLSDIRTLYSSSIATSDQKSFKQMQQTNPKEMDTKYNAPHVTAIKNSNSTMNNNNDLRRSGPQQPTTPTSKLLGKNPAMKSVSFPFPGTPPVELKPNMPSPSRAKNVFEHRPFPEPFFPSSDINSILLPPPKSFKNQ